MLDTEKKISKKEKALLVLDGGDKDITPNPDQLEELKYEGSEFSKLMESADAPEFKSGDVVKGKITDIRDDFVVVDINYKSEGIIPKSEFRLLKDKNTIEVGQEIEVYIDQIENDNGSIVLSKDKADIKKAWQDIIRAKENNETVQGTVVAQVKGGLSVDIGVRAFLPGSQLSFRPVKNMKSYVGQTYDFKVIKVNQKRGNIVISRKVLLEKDKTDMPKMTDLKEGSTIKGIVKNITDYGAFVDLGECDGLLHITDMSWSRIDHPSSVVKVGQEIDLKILKFDPEKNRVSLGLKQLDQSKWDEIISKFEMGSVLKGKVSNLVDYGAFVLLEGGIKGLVHVNEISWTKKIKNASHVLNVGDEVTVKVIDIQKESYKLSLSIKQAIENPWDKIKEKFSVGQDMEVPVVSISDFGLFVKVDEDIDGLVHVSDLSWTGVVNVADKYKVGDIVKVKILDINPTDEKFSLGIKQFEQNPWEFVEEKYPVGSRHEVQVSRIVDFGVFVKLAQEIEGLIHISELSTKRVNKPQDVVKVGDKVTAEILNIDQDSKKIGLSIRVVESGGSSPNVSNRSNQSSSSKTGSADNSSFMENIFAKVLKRSLKNEEDSSSDQEAASKPAAEASKPAEAAANQPEKDQQETTEDPTDK